MPYPSSLHMTQHMVTPMVATWIPMLTVHQIMAANVTPTTKLIQMVITPTHVIKDLFVLISMNVLLKHTTVTKTPLVPIMMVVSLVLTNDECTTSNNDCYESRSVCTKVDSAVLAMLVTVMITLSDDNLYCLFQC